MNKAAGYVRLSQESDRSIDAQKEDIKTYCRDRFELVRIYDDGQNSSGYKEDRDEYQQMLTLIREGGVDAVVVRGLERLSRDQKTRIRLLLELDDLGVDLHDTERGQIDTDDPWSIVQETVKATSDDVEKRKEIERAKKEVERRVENGYHQGRPRFGMKFDDDGKYLVPGDDFDTVREILRYDRLDKTLREIEELTGVGYTTVRNVLERRQWYVKQEKKAEN